MDKVICVATKGVVVYGGKCLLVQRAGDEGIDPLVWEFAGGKLEFGETPEAGLQREILEEAGLRATVERMLYTATFFTSAQRQVVLLCYLCRAGDSVVTLSEEHSAYRWVTVSEAEALLPKAILDDLNKHRVFEFLRENGIMKS